LGLGSHGEVASRSPPLIEAELALVDAEIRVLTAHGGPSKLDWRRLHRVIREAAARAARHGASSWTKAA
jgi:hypothetical protein